MAENEWGDGGAPAPVAKKRIPAWVWWGCGGGCLLLLLAGAAAAVLGYRVFRSAMDPEKAWADVQEILPFDQRPAGWSAHGTLGHYFVTPDQPERSQLVVQRFRSRGELDSWFDPDSPQNKGFLGLGQIHDPQAGTIEVQGRAVRCLRFQPWMPDSSRNDAEVSSVRIDVSGQGSIQAQVQINLPGHEGVPDEVVVQLLAPFDLWRGR